MTLVRVKRGLRTSSASSDPLDLPLATAQNLSISYLGFFATPTDINYGGGCMSMDGSSAMYVCGNNNSSASLSKISIPSIGGTATSLISSTSVATAGGSWANRDICSGSLVYNGNLYIQRTIFYDGLGEQDRWIAVGTKSITGIGTYNGISATNGTGPRKLAQGMGHIPALWQSALGGPCFATGGRAGIITNCNMGNGFAVFDPANVQATNSNVPVIDLLSYNDTHPLEPFPPSAAYTAYTKNAQGGVDLFSVHPNYNGTAFIPSGSRSLVFVHLHAYGADGTDSGCRPGSSVHADPNRVQLVAYDLRDVVSVKQGSLQPYQPFPYVIDVSGGKRFWVLPDSDSVFDECVGNFSGGSSPANFCYDPANGRLYGAPQGTGESTGERRIYVWQVGAVS